MAINVSLPLVKKNPPGFLYGSLLIQLNLLKNFKKFWNCNHYFTKFV